MRLGHRTHPLSFEYGRNLTVESTGCRLKGRHSELTLSCGSVTEGCLRLRLDNGHDRRQYSQAIREPYREIVDTPPLNRPPPLIATAAGQVRFQDASLAVTLASGLQLVTLERGVGAGGEALILNFQVEQVSGFYGAGSRTGKLNKSGGALDFWNVDVVAEFPFSYQRDDYDPTYVSVPLLILKQAGGYCGLFFDNPGRAVLDVERQYNGVLSYQSLSGLLDVYMIDGPRLRDVVRRFGELTGRHELPPLWALGYHQCRWGYQTEDDFLDLKDRFAHFDIPVSALWHDIDYMDGYRLFTWNRDEFPDPTRLGRTLKSAGIHSVTIIDPGVKRDPGYAVYDDGKARDVFCKAPSGEDFVGLVWPGDTVFPDFSLAAVRDWWAGHMAGFLRESSVDGGWLDMNEPATGHIDEQAMRFEQGAVPHDRYHNQYALLMARASREAVRRLDPDGRAFLLSRGGWAGIQRYAAVWTGDNCSNWAHLRMSIPATLNLGLSGVAFNGPDVGGFMGHTTPELLIRWYQAGFLFPFFRNHSMRDSKTQEPWQFDERCLHCARDAIRTRYRLLPYLYNLFFQHWLTGDPVLRPLLYEYDGEELENLDEQYLLGDALMAAPIVHGEGSDRVVVKGGEKRHLRYITFPTGWWYDLNRGQWLEGGCILPYAAALDEVPLFARDGAVIPWYNGPLHNSRMDLSRLELHLFSKTQPAETTLYIDDRNSLAYQNGAYNTVTVRAEPVSGGWSLSLTEQGGYPSGTVDFVPVLYGVEGVRTLEVSSNGRSRRLSLSPDVRRWVGKDLAVLA